MNHTVYLEDRHTPLVVSEETYHLLQAVAQAGLVCERCDQPYTEQRPQVVQNYCLDCFAGKHHSLVFLGQSNTLRGKYYWLGQDGYVYESGMDGRETSRSIFETLQYHRFPYPETYRRESGSTEELSPYRWRIHGTFQKNSVVILEYEDTIRSLHLLVVSYKRGTWIEVDRRKGPTRRLMIEARRAIEATKEGPHTWYVHGVPCYKVEESDLYTVASDLESARYTPPSTLG